MELDMEEPLITNRDSRAGPELALLLLAAFRLMIDEVTRELGRRGHPDVRASHEFAMRAILSGADSAVALARTLSVTKQAAAKTIVGLEERGYLTRSADHADARRKRLVLTARGQEMLVVGGEILNEIRRRWANHIGPLALAELEHGLRTIVGENAALLDTVGWLAKSSAD
jgi:DNA-binding MarR family transcriptional regulator